MSEKQVRAIHIALLLVLMAVIHFSAIPLGLYQGKVWIDMPLHVMGGIFFSMVGLLLFQKKLDGTSNFIKIFSIISFALFGSFLWELFELGFGYLFPSGAGYFKLYSFTVSDALSDMSFGIFGGIIVSYLFKKTRRIK